MEVKIVKSGFFAENYGTCFIKFENITSIESPSKNYSTGRWEVLVRHIKLKEEIVFTFTSNQKEAITVHKNLLEAWVTYHTKSTNLEEQIEKLLSSIDIIPGGKEYEETKNRFENRVSGKNEEKNEKFELTFQ